MAQQSYQLINLDQSIDLLWPSSFGTPPYVLDLNDVNPTTALDHFVRLPDATLVSVGQTFIFNNVGMYDFGIKDFAGNQLPAGEAIEAGDIYQFYLVGNATPAGEWRTIPWGSGTSGIVSFTSKSTDSSIVLNGDDTNPSITVTNPGGEVDYTLPLSISNLYKNITLEGFIAVTDTAPLTYESRTFVGGNNISIQNANGGVGNPIISVVGDIDVDQIKVGTIQIQDDTITTTATNEDIHITTTGTGVVDINGVTFDSNGDINLNGGSITGIGGLTSIRAYVNFFESIPGVIAISNKVNVLAVDKILLFNGNYQLTFETPMPDNDYGVLITTGTVIDVGNLPVITNGYYIQSTKTVNGVTIVITDAVGEFMAQVPNGVTVMIISS